MYCAVRNDGGDVIVFSSKEECDKFCECRTDFCSMDGGAIYDTADEAKEIWGDTPDFESEQE